MWWFTFIFIIHIIWLRLHLSPWYFDIFGTTIFFSSCFPIGRLHHRQEKSVANPTSEMYQQPWVYFTNIWGGAKIGGSQKWMVYMENPSRMDDFGAPQSWKPPYCTGVYKITIDYGQSGQSFNHATAEFPSCHLSFWWKLGLNCHKGPIREGSLPAHSSKSLGKSMWYHLVK